MRLKGKAEKDFFDWYWKDIRYTDEDMDMFYQDSPTSYVGYIIEWFDTQRIYILVCLNNENFSYDIKEYLTLDGDLRVHTGLNSISRQDALENAVYQANKIYNENK